MMGGTRPRPQAMSPAPFQSPSGLLTRAAWERELESAYDHMPDWYWVEADCEREFLRWVYRQAMTLAGQFERMLRPDTPPALARHVRALLVALSEDAEWALRCLAARSVDTAAE